MSLVLPSERQNLTYWVDSKLKGGHSADALLIDYISKNAPCHRMRSEYARDLYAELKDAKERGVDESDGITTIEFSKYTGNRIFEIPHSESDGETIYYVVEISEGTMAYGVASAKYAFYSYAANIVDSTYDHEIHMYHVDSAAEKVYILVEGAATTGMIRLSYNKEVLK